MKQSAPNLEQAIKNRLLVRVVREELVTAGTHLIGVPLSAGKEWMICARMTDAIQMDGYDAIRLTDVAFLEANFPRRKFYIKGLSVKRAVVPALPHLRLNSTSEMLLSVQRWFSLVTIDRERVNPSACEIGVLKSVRAGHYQLRLITPAGRFVSGSSSYPIDDATRVSFGGEYEETLAAAAGLRDPKWE